MNHLDTAQLRRMLDEPEEFTQEQRDHVAECEPCRTQRDELAANVAAASRAMSGSVAVDSADAFARVRREAARARTPVAFSYRNIGSLAAAAVLALALIFTPLGTLARSFLTIFEPQQFQPIRITHAEIEQFHNSHRLLPQADEIGTQRVIAAPQHASYATFAAAQQHVDFTALAPSTIPADVRGGTSYHVTSPEEMTFTFSAAKTRAFAARSHRTLPPMPAGLDGTTIRFQAGSILETRLGSQKNAHAEIVQMRAPKVSSSGASLQTLEQYILSMPNVPRELADQIRALGDIQNTVPVPVMIDKQTARHVNINGKDALAIGDNTGVGAGVMWQNNGIIYVVAGPVRMDDALSIANGLK